MTLHRFTESSSEFKQKRLIFQDTTGTIEHAPSAPDTKSQLRVLSLSIIMAMKNGGKYELGDFKNWPKEKQEDHYRKLAQTMPKSFNEELFFSAKNPFLRDLEINVGLYVPDCMNTDDLVAVETEPDGSTNVNFKNGKTQEWIRFEPEHVVIKAIKWMEEQLKNEPNPTKDQVETIVGTIRQLKEHEGKSATDLIENPSSPEKPEDHTEIHKKHANFHETTYKTAEKIAQVITGDQGTLRNANLKDIRQKGQLLVKEEAKNDEQKRSYLVEETARRLRAYCDKMPDGWFKLNYSRVGGDLHLENVGLGEILLDPDIEEVEIKTKSGKIFTAHRGIVESGQHKGRQAFIAKGKPYVDTYDGDMFRIKSQTSLETPAYIQKADTEQKARETQTVTVSTVTGKGRAKVEQEIKEEPITYKSPETRINGPKINLTVKMVQDAEQEARASDKIEEVLEKRPNFMAVVNYAAEHVGVPAWIILATMFHESRFNFHVKNGKDGEIGMGQFKKAAWISTRSDEKFTSTMDQVINENPRTMERQRSLLADALCIAIFAKRGMAEGTTHLSHLDQEALEGVRFRYHMPTYYMAIKTNGKGYYGKHLAKAQAFVEKRKSSREGEAQSIYGYKYFADTALKFEAAWKAKFKTD